MTGLMQVGTKIPLRYPRIRNIPLVSFGCWSGFGVAPTTLNPFYNFIFLGDLRCGVSINSTMSGVSFCEISSSSPDPEVVCFGLEVI
jgi:hypothetical protein